MSDKKYLFKRNNVWWVKLAVPLSLRSELGYDLRRTTGEKDLGKAIPIRDKIIEEFKTEFQIRKVNACLLYTSPSPRDTLLSRMPSSA